MIEVHALEMDDSLAASSATAHYSLAMPAPAVPCQHGIADLDRTT